MASDLPPLSHSLQSWFLLLLLLFSLRSYLLLLFRCCCCYSLPPSSFSSLTWSDPVWLTGRYNPRTNWSAFSSTSSSLSSSSSPSLWFNCYFSLGAKYKLSICFSILLLLLVVHWALNINYLLSICLSVCPSFSRSQGVKYLSICLSICLSVYSPPSSSPYCECQLKGN